MRQFVILVMLAMMACSRSNNRPANDTALSLDSVSIYLEKRLYNPYMSGSSKEAFSVLDSIYPSIAASGHTGALSSWWRLRSVAYSIEKKYDSTEFCLNKAISLFPPADSLNLYVLWAKAEYAFYLTDINEFERAINYYMGVYIHKEKVDTGLLIKVIGELSHIHGVVGDSVNERKYLYEGIATTRNPRLIRRFANELAIYYAGQHKDDSAQKYREIAAMHAGNQHARERSMLIFDEGEILRHKKQFSPALEKFMQSLEIVREDTGFVQAVQYHAIAVTLTDLGNIERSNRYLDTSSMLAKKREDFYMLSENFRSYSVNFTRKGQYEQAYSYLDSARKLHKISDSVSFQQQARDLETKYQTKMKDDQIYLLGREKELSDQVSRQRLISLILAIAGGVFLLAMSVLLARKRQSRLQAQQTYLYLRLLRTQIDPHFLFNALTVVKSYVKENAHAVDYVSKMAQMLRYSLINASANYVPLRDEVSALHGYIGMQKVHKGNMFDYEINVYEGYEDDMVFIPPMLIQPFVENAIIHGISTLTDRKGKLTITIQKEKNVLKCTIQDNGSGLPAVQNVDDKRPHAATITADRLRILGKQLGRKAALQIAQRKTEGDHGVIVTMIIPFKKEQPSPDYTHHHNHIFSIEH